MSHIEIEVEGEVWIAATFLNTKGVMWTVARLKGSYTSSWRREGDHLNEAVEWIKALMPARREQPEPEPPRGDQPTLSLWLATLGLCTIPTCPDELKRAYRRMATFWHPDCEDGSEEGFKRLTVARDQLTQWLGWGDVR